jgi:hypothetical protein
MVLDRLRADVRGLRDGTVRQTVTEVGHDLAFPRAQTADAFLRAVAGTDRRGAAVDDRVGDFGGRAHGCPRRWQ